MSSAAKTTQTAVPGPFERMRSGYPYRGAAVVVDLGELVDVERSTRKQEMRHRNAETGVVKRG